MADPIYAPSGGYNQNLLLLLTAGAADVPAPVYITFIGIHTPSRLVCCIIFFSGLFAVLFSFPAPLLRVSSFHARAGIVVPYHLFTHLIEMLIYSHRDAYRRAMSSILIEMLITSHRVAYRASCHPFTFSSSIHAPAGIVAPC